MFWNHMEHNLVGIEPKPCMSTDIGPYLTHTDQRGFMNSVVERLIHSNHVSL